MRSAAAPVQTFPQAHYPRFDAVVGPLTMTPSARSPTGGGPRSARARPDRSGSRTTLRVDHPRRERLRRGRSGDRVRQTAAPTCFRGRAAFSIAEQQSDELGEGTPGASVSVTTTHGGPHRANESLEPNAVASVKLTATRSRRLEHVGVAAAGARAAGGPAFRSARRLDNACRAPGSPAAFTCAARGGSRGASSRRGSCFMLTSSRRHDPK